MTSAYIAKHSEGMAAATRAYRARQSVSSPYKDLAEHCTKATYHHDAWCARYSLKMKSLRGHDKEHVIMNKETSNGTHANYYLIPDTCKTFADLAIHKQMEAWQSKLFLGVWAYVLKTYVPTVRANRMSLDGMLPKVVITDLSDLMAAYNVNHPIGEALCELYRFHQVAHSGSERGLNKIGRYLDIEMSRVNAHQPENFSAIHDLVSRFVELRPTNESSRNGRGEWTT